MTSEAASVAATGRPLQVKAAVALFRARELAAARQACEALIAEARETPGQGGHALRAEASYWAARCARRQESPDAALRLLYDGLAAAQAGQQGRAECLIRAEIVHVLSALGQNKDALEQADVALQRARQLQCPVGQAAAQEALASIHWMTDAWELGLTAYTEALELACVCDDLELRVLCTLGLAATQDGVARLARDAGRTEEADAGARRSIALQLESGRLAAALGDDHLTMYSQLNHGCSLHSLGEFEEAKAVMLACLADSSREAVHGNTLATLGQIALDQGDAASALPLLTRALEICERLQKPFPMLIALELLVDAHEAVGDTAEALACMRRYHALHVKNMSDKARMLAQAVSVKYETERALAMALAERLRAELLERSNADLATVSALHERAAMEDALTGLANRRRFDLALRALASADGSLRPCAVAMIDLDHFKQINDQHSHAVGDAVLRRIGGLLAANRRRDDLVARYGGEEFVLLTTDLKRAEMMQLCERIRQAVEREAWSAVHPSLRVTVSIGAAHCDELGGDAPVAAPELLALADSRLYIAKRSGRNQVCDGGSGLPAAAGV